MVVVNIEPSPNLGRGLKKFQSTVKTVQQATKITGRLKVSASAEQFAEVRERHDHLSKAEKQVDTSSGFCMTQRVESALGFNSLKARVPLKKL